MATRKKTGRARVPRDGSWPHEVHYVPRVVAKFRDEVQLPYTDGMEWLEAQHLGAWRELAQRYPGIRMRRLFNSVKPARLAAMVEEARNRDRTYRPPNFFTYFVTDCPAADPEKLALDLRKWPAVENACVDPPGEDPVANPGDDPRSPNQGYLDGEP